MAKPTKLKVTSKGQVTLRKEVLHDLGVAEGEYVVLEKLADGRYALGPPPKGDISRVFGMLKRPGQPRLTIEEINQAIADGWAGKR